MIPKHSIILATLKMTPILSGPLYYTDDTVTIASFDPENNPGYRVEYCHCSSVSVYSHIGTSTIMTGSMLLMLSRAAGKGKKRQERSVTGNPGESQLSHHTIPGKLGSTLGVLFFVLITKESKNGHKRKLEDKEQTLTPEHKLLGFKRKALGQASCESHSCLEGKNKEGMKPECLRQGSRGGQHGQESTWQGEEFYKKELARKCKLGSVK